MKDRILLQLLRVLPRNAYSRALGRVGSVPLPRGLRSTALGLFARRYGIDTDEAELPLSDYPSLDAFFTRRIKAGLRPVDPRPDVVVSPADGRLAATGRITDGRLLQVKGLDYRLDQLLQDPEAERWFAGGSFCTIYLCPTDYHRVHFPAAGAVLGYRYLPGTLYPVNTFGVSNIHDLFVINERLVTYQRSASLGHMAVIMVGALAVGRISLSYDGLETNGGGLRTPALRRYEEPLERAAGDELGVFHLGSTVVLLCEDGSLSATGAQGARVRVGQALMLRSEAPGPRGAAHHR